jgi:hypothetical protein
MQNDIIPPNLRRPSTNTSKNQLMKSLRLRGHSASDAKKRLVKAESKLSAQTPKNPEREAEAVIALDNVPTGRRKPHEWLKHHLSKRSKIELAALAAVFLLGSGTLVFLVMHFAKKPVTHVASNPVVKPAPAPKPTTVASPLSGVQVAPDLAQRPVTGIMIENSPDARPQSGLQDAGVVYEAIAEGGITRFLALFQDTRPSYIGPVRSLRPYYIDFGWPYQASIAHVGGSPDALAQIRSAGYRDLDQFFNSGTYSRISSRAAPHNVYTDFDRLDQLNKAKGFNSSQFTPWKRKDDKPLATPTNAHIDVKISSALYYSHYDYDKASNTYMRSEGGRPHVELTSSADRAGTQIHPKVIVTLSMNYSVIDAAGHSGYGVTGSGQMYVFQDGGVTQGTWSKADRNSMFEFKDASGQPITLNTGQTWVTAVKSPADVSATP